MKRRHRQTAGALLLLAIAFGAGACANGNADEGGPPPGFQDDPETQPGNTDAADAATVPDARDAAEAPACTCGSPGCGACPTVNMITAGPVKIDGIEVTTAAYAEFLAARPKSSGMPAACAGNEVTPAGWRPSGREALPVTGVDWCDAYAYCRWAKKRLCGAITSGPVGFMDFADPSKSQWSQACTAGKTNPYPYGPIYQATACNGADQGKNAPVPAGVFSQCVGGVPALFDMSGNVWEWEDGCDSAAANAQCRIRGGSYTSGQAVLGCSADGALPRNESGPSIGFRCCQ